MQASSISIRLNCPNGSVIRHCSSVSMALRKHGFAFTSDQEIIDHRMRVYHDERGRFITGDLTYLGGPMAAAEEALERVRCELGQDCVSGGRVRMYNEIRGPMLIVGAPRE